jgi:DNA-binding transcriptional LysR family regulator
MRLANLEIFQEVYQRGNFSLVARSRNLAPSVISRAIAALEDELGTLLFYRTTRNVTPTEAATFLAGEIEQHLDALRSLRSTLADSRDKPSGPLRISASHSFGTECLSLVIPNFCEQYPEVEVQLTLTDQIVDIVGERFDLALRHGPLPNSSLIARPVLRTRYFACASPSYVARKGKPATPEDIRNMNCLTFPWPGLENIWRFRDSKRKEIEVPVRSAFRVNSGLVLRECARQGQGVVLLICFLHMRQRRRTFKPSFQRFIRIVNSRQRR